MPKTELHLHLEGAVDAKTFSDLASKHGVDLPAHGEAADLYRYESLVDFLGFGTSLGAYQIEEGESATQIVTNLGLDAQGNTIVGPVGNANPDFKVSFGNDLEFGNFSLYGLWDWQQGGTIINLTKLLYDFGSNYVDHEVPTDPFDIGGGTVISGTTGEVRLGRFLNGDSRGYMDDATYLKLRELSISYRFPPDVLTGMIGNRVLVVIGYAHPPPPVGGMLSPLSLGWFSMPVPIGFIQACVPVFRSIAVIRE